ncbi:MAG: hypothetical protein QF615_10575 [Planctomycetota bacterium]|nr:hypothetical protein [Planctomycetota bacterium]
MSQLRVGDSAPVLTSATADGGNFDNRDLAGRRYLLSFQRYAT